MFDTGFPFSLIQHNSFQNEVHPEECIFQFKTLHKRYLVIIEEYEQQVFVPKFYPSSEQNNPNRFAVLTNEHVGSKVIQTIINIMLDIYKNNPTVSFAWIGVATDMRNKKEGKSFTQRYRIYKSVMLNFFSSENWLHYDDYVTSTYLLINKKQLDTELFLQNVIRMFTDLYPDLEVI